MGQVEQYLRMMTEMRKKIHSSSEFKYCCFEEFVLKYGQEFKNYMPKPKWVKKGIIKECFSNCFKEATTHPDRLTYCEGYALGVIPVHHAWLLYDDKVIDPTWDGRNIVKEHTEYFGIKFNFKYIMKVAIETGYYGVLDNFAQKFPLLRGEHKPDLFLVDAERFLVAGIQN